jgi:hypothetical protein
MVQVTGAEVSERAVGELDLGANGGAARARLSAGGAIRPGARPRAPLDAVGGVPLGAGGNRGAHGRAVIGDPAVGVLGEPWGTRQDGRRDAAAAQESQQWRRCGPS